MHYLFRLGVAAQNALIVTARDDLVESRIARLPAVNDLLIRPAFEADVRRLIHCPAQTWRATHLLHLHAGRKPSLPPKSN